MPSPAPAPASAPVVFDPDNPNFGALTWNPTYVEARGQLMHDLYGTRYDGVQMRTINAPTTWPRWATVIIVAVPSPFVLGAIAVFVLAPSGYDAFALVLLGFAGFAAVAGLTVRGVIRYLGRIAAEGWRRVKLERLATDNGLVYRQRAVAPHYPGCIFTTGTSNPYVYNDFRTSSPRVVDFGNYHAVSEGNDGPQAAIAPPPGSSWGFMAIQLDRQLPNLLLVSKTRQAGDVTLPVSPNPSQTLSLEGDFDRYFTLYCPKESERDALYVITPDLMALLIDQATPFDVEIVDNWMFFYSRIPFDLLSQDLWHRLFNILQTIGGKVIRQTSHFMESGAAVSQPAESGAAISQPAESGAAISQPADSGAAISQPADSARHLAGPPAVGGDYLAARALVSRRSAARVVGTIVIAAIVTAAASAIVWFAVQSLVQ